MRTNERLRPLSRSQELIVTLLLAVVAWAAAYAAHIVVAGVFNAVTDEPVSRPQSVYWAYLSFAVFLGVPVLCGFLYGRSRRATPDKLAVFVGWLVGSLAPLTLARPVQAKDVLIFVIGALLAFGATLLGFREAGRASNRRRTLNVR